MDPNKSMRNKRRLMGFLAIIIALSMLLSIIAPFLETAKADTLPMAIPVDTNVVVDETSGLEFPKNPPPIGQEDFDVDVKIGYEGIYVPWCITPAFASIGSKTADFSGSLAIDVWTSETNNSKYLKTTYTYPVSVKKGERVSVSVAPRMGFPQSEIQINLIDDAGNTVYGNTVKAVPTQEATLLVGVFSPDKTGFFFQEKPTYGSFLANRLVGNNQDSMVLLDETALSMVGEEESFSHIILDGINPDDLGAEQKKNLQAFVVNGGTVSYFPNFFKNGPKRQGMPSTNFTFLGENILFLPTEDLNPLKGNTYEFDKSGKDAMFLGEGEILDSISDQPPLCWQQKFGKGKVLFFNHSFDGSDREYFSMLQSQIGGIVDQYSREKYRSRGGFWLENPPPVELHVMFFYWSMILLYILLLGPGVWYYVKKKKNVVKGATLLPILALMLSGIFFLFGFTSPYLNGYFGAIGISHILPGSPVARQEIRGVAKSPEKGQTVVSFGESLPNLYSYTDQWYYNSYPMFHKDLKNMETILTTAKGEIKFPFGASYRGNFFELKKNIDLGGGLNTHILLNGNHLTGKVYNNTNVDFSDVILFVGNQYQYIPQLASGAVLDIDITLDPNIEANEYDLSDAWGTFLQDSIGKTSEKGKLSKREEYRIDEQISLLKNTQYQLQDGSNSWSALDVLFFGFGQEGLVQGNISINGKSPLQETLSIYSMKTNFLMEPGQPVEIPAGILYPDYDPNSVDKRDKRVIYIHNDMGTQEQILEYSLPDSLEIQKLSLLYPRNTNIVKMEVYHVDNDTWDMVKNGQELSAQRYLDDQGKVTIRISFPGQGELYMPSLALKGVGKRVGD